MKYDQFTAVHYAAYRPPLHLPILKKCIPSAERFENGLDVGCGTGQSTVALANFCKHVTGIDPNEAMLEQAIPHERITYVPSKGELVFENDSFDIITFAGSLYYAKSQSLLDEVLRVCTEKATIIVYDFQLLLQPILTLFGIDAPEATTYNHEEDFSGLNTAHLARKKKANELLSIAMDASQLAHVLLSEESLALSFVEKYGESSLFESILSQLELYKADGAFDVEALVYYSTYCKS